MDRHLSVASDLLFSAFILLNSLVGILIRERLFRIENSNCTYFRFQRISISLFVVRSDMSGQRWMLVNVFDSMKYNLNIHFILFNINQHGTAESWQCSNITVMCNIWMWSEPICCCLSNWMNFIHLNRKNQKL